MALKDLKSNLSWYGKEAPGFKPNANRRDTDFKVNDDSTISTIIQGYGITGAARSFRQAISSDKFIISDQGDSSRAAQLGSGTRFPIGPEGQIHKFDKLRTGFSDKVKYGDQYGVKFGNAGLADTYTANSPIDDMYNKFNLRDDATPNSYIKHPLILRGIQRDDNSNPQRWGINVGPGASGAFDIPRGGIVTAANRTLIDAVRHAKFLASPRGLGFLAKQVGYQLMNPYKETRLYNPLSLGSIAPIVHINRHLGGELATSILSLGVKPDRLANLRGELFTDFDKDNSPRDTAIGSEISSLSSKFGGPGSIFGIGGTSITRYEDTSLKTQLEGTQDGVLAAIGNGSSSTNKFHKYSFGSAYIKARDANESGETMGRAIDGDSSADERPGGLRDTFDPIRGNPNWPVISPSRGGDGTALPGGGIADTKGKTDTIVTEYTRMAYGDIPNRRPDTTKINDFRQEGSKNVLLEKDHPGIHKAGKLWKNSKDKFRTEVDETSAEGKFDSFIDFFIGGIEFKAYINSLSDSFAPNWDGQADQGRADSRYLYTGFERTINIDFTVATESAAIPAGRISQRGQVWSKLQSLARKVYPVYGGSTIGFRGQFVNVTIGDLYVSVPMIITDLSYDWDNETPWEIDNGIQAPFYTNVSISLTVIDNKPTSKSTIYSCLQP